MVVPPGTKRQAKSRIQPFSSQITSTHHRVSREVCQARGHETLASIANLALRVGEQVTHQTSRAA